ncbi:hypothetical protein TNCV_3276841 [Trichonephila clavipes]|nr:hypothetical protein TNCV_3276841 [Trichonephila clavipes]
MMVYGDRPRPIHGRRSCSDISFEIPSFSENTTGKKHLTVEIIRIIILLRFNQERNKTNIGAWARAQLAHTLRRPWGHGGL